MKANYSWDIKAAKPITGGVPLFPVRNVNILRADADPNPAPAPEDPLTVWFRRMPGTWTDMIPIGNGHMGAMIAGRPEREYLILNEDTIWAGGPYDHLNPDASPEKLAQMRQLIFDGKADQAGNIANSSFISRPSAEMAFSVAGALGLDQDTGNGDVTDYIHSLNIREAVAQTKFTRDGVTYTREYFASYPDRVVAMRLTADKPASITVGAFIGTAQDLQAVKVEGNTMTLTGRTIDYNGIKGATNIQITGRVFNKGGKLVSGERGISVEKADSVVILLDAESSFKAYNDVSGDPAKRIDDVFKKFATVDYDALKKAHVADYRKLFDRVTFDLGGTPSKLPTDERLNARRQPGNQLDPDLASLYFQFGRYLLIASSRPGSQPANLQGIWSEEVNVPWQSKYTININAEMNYWPAETANLSECHEPLFDMIHEMVPNGKKAAKKLYNVDHGWVAHHNTDLWRQCGPIDFSPTGMWPMGGAWLCLHFWDHYEFTRNLDDLRKHYPVMKESVKFYLDFLQPDPNHGGVLVTIPSYSPEQGGLCASPTMDTGILTALFKATIESSKLLGDDPAVEEEHAVRHVAGEGHLVRDDDHRHLLLREAADDLEDLARELRVERGGRLVEEEHLRVERQRARDRDALLLAAGELARVGVRLRGESHLVQQVHRVRRRLLARAAEHDALRLGDVAQHREVREEVELLEDEPDAQQDAPLHGLRGVDAVLHEVVPADADRAGGDGLEVRHAPQERRLAAARGADHREHVAAAQRERDAVEHLVVAERLAEVLDEQQRVAVGDGMVGWIHAFRSVGGTGARLPHPGPPCNRSRRLATRSRFP